MSLEDDLRVALHDDPAPTGGGLDARAAIAGARRRRRPRVAIATGATAFAAVGVLAIALPAVLQPIGATSTSGGAPMSDQVQMTESDAGVADSTLESTCGLPASAWTAYVPADSEPAEMMAAFEDVVVKPEGSIEGVLVLTSSATVTLDVSTSLPPVALLISGDEIVGHSSEQVMPTSGNAGEPRFALDAGSSFDYPVSLTVVACGGVPLAELPSDLEVVVSIHFSTTQADVAKSGYLIGLTAPVPVEFTD